MLSVLSFHLKRLKQIGLVPSRRAGQNILYAADFQPFRRDSTWASGQMPNQ